MSLVSWLGRKSLVTAAPDDFVDAATRRMVEQRVGALLIVDDGKLQAVFSERDLLRRVVAVGRDPATTRLSEVATLEPKVIHEDTPLPECAALIRRYGFRHVPIVDVDGAPVGIISARDFLDHVVGVLEAAIEKAYREQRLEELVDPFEMG